MEWLGGEKEEQIDSETEATIRAAREARRKAEEELAAVRIEQIRQGLFSDRSGCNGMPT